MAEDHVALEVGDQVIPELDISYYVTKNIALELVLALGTRHDVNVKGAGGLNQNLGSVNLLPPTLTAQWHFRPDQTFDPYVGVGVNYTRFFSTKTEGPIAGAELELSDSWGLAGHVGIDFQVGAKGAIRVDYRRIDIDTKAKLNGANLGTSNTVNIDPSVYGVAYVFQF